MKHQMEGAEGWDVLEKKEEKPRDSNLKERDWEEKVLGSKRKMKSGEWDLTKKRRDLIVRALAIRTVPIESFKHGQYKQIYWFRVIELVHDSTW